MPSRNVLKVEAPESYYHVYARGSTRQTIFLEKSDFEYFERLFQRYLARNNLVNSGGQPYPYHGDRLRLLCYCLMPNHFHLLVYQEAEKAMSAFMRSLMTSYSRYFNTKYKRTGSLFESRYKAVRIDQQNYLEHVTRYIHLNPRYWKRYRYSSVCFYARPPIPGWLKPEAILSLFESGAAYVAFLEDYENHKAMLDQIKHELADT